MVKLLGNTSMDFMWCANGNLPQNCSRSKKRCEQSR